VDRVSEINKQDANHNSVTLTNSMLQMTWHDTTATLDLFARLLCHSERWPADCEDVCWSEKHQPLMALQKQIIIKQHVNFCTQTTKLNLPIKSLWTSI